MRDCEYYFHNNTMVDYEEDPRFKFPVPQIPVVRQWEQENTRTESKVEELRSGKNSEPPEVAPRTSRNVLMAILSQGDLQFKLRKVPPKHKKEYQSISQMASSLGRLTRLLEHVIESVSSRDDSLEEKEWTPRKSPLAATRSSGHRLSIEAAAMGRILRLKEEYFTSWDEDDEEREEWCESNQDLLESPLDHIDDARDHRGFLMQRSSLLIHNYVRQSRIAKMEKDWDMEFEEFLEEAESHSTESTLPKFQPRKPEKQMSRDEILESLARDVAEKWWERRYRLERPGAELRVHATCNCAHCKKPRAQSLYFNASQTTLQIRDCMGEERTPPSPLDAGFKPKISFDSNCFFRGFD